MAPQYTQQQRAFIDAIDTKIRRALDAPNWAEELAAYFERAPDALTKRSIVLLLGARVRAQRDAVSQANSIIIGNVFKRGRM